MAYYCPNCGEPVKNADRFCQSCGYQLSEDIDLPNLSARTSTQSSGNLQDQSLEQIEPEEVVEPTPLEDYQRHTYDYKGKQEQEYRDPRNSYTYERSGVEYFNDYNWPLRSRITAGILAILLGGTGVHKFYLGKTGQGVLMLLFAWTGIPGLIGHIQGIIYLTQGDEEFSEKNHVRVQ